jgi:iron(III) transport system permease protein
VPASARHGSAFPPPAPRTLRVAARPAAWLGRAALALVVALLVVYPLAMVVASIVFADAWGVRPLALDNLGSPRVVRAWSNTLLLGGAVTLLAIAFALPAALVADRSRAARLVDLVMAVPFLTPPFLVSLAWTQAVGRRGYASRLGLDGVLLQDALFSLAGMAVLMAVNYAPLVYFALRAQLAALPSALTWAAANAGAGRWTRLQRIVLPLLAPALLAGGFLAFASAIGEYGTPLVIGQRIGYPVVATEIARLVNVFPIDLTLASALGATLLLVGAGAYVLSRVALRGDLRVAGRSHYPPPVLLPAWARAGAGVVVAVFALVGIVVPFASLITTSLLRLISQGPRLDNLTLQHYAELLTVGTRGFGALTASLTLALLASLAGLVLGALAARAGRGVAFLASLPIAIPAITMAVGYIRGWNAPWAAGLPVYGTATILLLYYLAQYLPFVVQYVQAGQAGISPSFERAARVHGAGAFVTFWRVVVPLLWPHALAGAILIFSIAFRELVGTVLLRPPAVQTSATYILQQFDQGSIASGTAMGVVAMAAALLSTITARRFAAR